MTERQAHYLFHRTQMASFLIKEGIRYYGGYYYGVNDIIYAVYDL